MRGCRPLTDEEVKLIASSFSGSSAGRDRCLFTLGWNSGFRVSELLSLTVGDVLQHREIVDRVTVQRRATKGKRESRTVVLNGRAQTALRRWLGEMGDVSPGTPLFPSRKGDGAISRVQAHRVLKAAVGANELQGKIASHSMRKTFAEKVYDKLDGDLPKLQKALGHASINSTISYLSFKQEDVDDAILSM
jgi:integrase